MDREELQAWDAIVQTNGSSLAALLIEGELVRENRQDTVEHPAPSPFGEAFCGACGDGFVWAQFWRAGRLWRVSGCSCDEGEAARVDSSPASAALPEGTAVDGNSAWIRKAAKFLPGPEMAAWDTAADVVALRPMFGRNGEGEYAFHAAACRMLGAVGDDHLDSRIGGVGRFIQWPHKPNCAECGREMPLLCQLGPDAGFHWADLGQLYVFACPDHPEQTKAFRDTH